jgi:hypothetical protein
VEKASLGDFLFFVMNEFNAVSATKPALVSKKFLRVHVFIHSKLKT